ncbi:MAG: putative toxin-antitoxin system toxin component, PIN family [Nitrospirae bacterium]|nr:putative toxin-antitoxin system toxin component, PIN family [Nitrospirota bacterium]MBI3604464.1 putative toxin-antitoxin system toxin component, PIN family [Nitrospirota bacterium]
MKIVFDSNIYISAFVVPGSQAEKAIFKVIEENVSLMISKEIISEVLRVLAGKFKREKEALSRTAVYLSDVANIVKLNRKIKVLKDEPDNRILECAVAGRADLIVTGDKEMLRLKEFEGIRIISLKEYLEQH